MNPSPTGDTPPRPCGALFRWKTVKDTTRAFFAELTVADLLTRDASHEAA